MTSACVTDRCDRCDRRVDVIIINHLPTPLSENQTHPAKGGFFVSESAKGRAPSLCSLCSLRIDGGGSPLSLEPLEVEQRGKEGREIVEHEGAKRSSSYLAPQAHSEEQNY